MSAHQPLPLYERFERPSGELEGALEPLSAPPEPLCWLQDPPRLAARLPQLSKPYELSFDEGDLGRRVRQGGELLWRATGAARAHAQGEAPPLIFDLTAGLCRDALLLAAAGAEVIAFERHPALYALALNAQQRSLSPHKARLHLVYGEASELLSALLQEAKHHAGGEQGEVRVSVAAHAPQRVVSVVYLDPMFPSRRKSAAVGKDAQLLQALTHSLERDEQARVSEERDLLALALAVAHHRVVVKRPIKAPALGGEGAPKPSAAIKGKAVRYDVYGLRSFTSSSP